MKKKETISWVTFQGKEVTLETIDHQHLSNIYWYRKIILNLDDNDDLIQMLINIANEKFNGQLLQYRPHVKHDFEIKTLKERGLLYKVNDRTELIIYNDEIIGEITKF